MNFNQICHHTLKIAILVELSSLHFRSQLRIVQSVVLAGRERPLFNGTEVLSLKIGRKKIYLNDLGVPRMLKEGRVYEQEAIAQLSQML